MTTRRNRTRQLGAVLLALFVVMIAGSPATPRLEAQGADANAGDWRMIVLTGPTQIAVPPPRLQ